MLYSDFDLNHRSPLLKCSLLRSADALPCPGSAVAQMDLLYINANIGNCPSCTIKTATNCWPTICTPQPDSWSASTARSILAGLASIKTLPGTKSTPISR